MAAATSAAVAGVTSSSKQLAVLQGELDGLICKLHGYERALEDTEMQLAESDLQVVLLKKFIGSIDTSSTLHANMQEVLEQQAQVQQHLQENMRPESLPPGPMSIASAHPAPHPASTAVQVSLLRAALAEANYRLAAAGLSPVAATDLPDAAKQNPTYSSASCSSTPLADPRRSYSRLFRNKYSTPPVDSKTISNSSSSSLSITPFGRDSSASSSGSSINTTQFGTKGSKGSRGSPCAPALCLASRLSRAATPSEGPDTPIGLDSKSKPLYESNTPGLRTSVSPLPCNTPAAAPGGPPAASPNKSAAAAASAVASAAGRVLRSDSSSARPHQAAAAAVQSKGPVATAVCAEGSAGQPEALISRGTATRSCSGFQELEPYTYDAGDFSDAELETDSTSSHSSSSHTQPATGHTQASDAATPVPASQLALQQSSSACLSPSGSLCLLASPTKAQTPPCSPCSTISCDSMYLGPHKDVGSVDTHTALVGSWGGATTARRYAGHRYAASSGAARLVPLGSLAGWPGVTCSVDNPLFAADEWASAGDVC